MNIDDKLTTAKKMIKEFDKVSKEMNEMWISNIMTTDRAEPYKELSNKLLNIKLQMIDIFGNKNFSAFNIAAKKHRLNLLVYGTKIPHLLK
jgi:hypothetical protein